MGFARRDGDVSVPPTECRVLSDGTVVELTDIPLVPTDLDAPVRIAQIAALPRERRGTLLALCYDLLVEHWQQVSFGPTIECAVYALRLASAPTTFSYRDGYLTMQLDPSLGHLQLQLGARHARAAFVRTLHARSLPTWSVQLSNGRGELMITFQLPSPYFDLQLGTRLREPAWEHLALWNLLRALYLGECTSQAPLHLD